ncbi:MAG: CRISPR-associated endonuclease Cas2 [Candidatus Zambryskibacteria bacterium]|nr:CRISPR-associated endonuclease Cas2 [Candidatus Zambryskibacteria bacterium]
MGEIEQRNKKRVRRTRTHKVILESIKLAGILSVALLAPNAIQALEELGFMPKKRQKEYISSSAAKLAKKGLLNFKNDHYELTKEGEKILEWWNINDYGFKKPKRWDKKWRMIIFDIPERKRKMRNKISEIFERAGLYRLQESVWVYPYDCEDIIGLLKTELGIGKEVLYVIADEIEDDKYLRAHYDLYNT